MTNDARRHADDLRAVSRLAIVATKGVTGVVREMHRTIASGPSLLGRPLAGPSRVLTDFVYGRILGVTSLVGVALDLALEQLGPLLGESTPGRERDAVLSAINGVFGDYLVETKSPLATEMHFRVAGAVLPLDAERLRERLPSASGKVLVLVHGLAMNDSQWLRRGHDHGASLARDLGYTAVYLRYNSGLHVSANGRSFAELLEALVRAWPTEVEEITLLGHSMGGLVSRSACHAAEASKLGWRSKLRRLVCLGSPHHGSPLERGGNWIDTLLGVSGYSAPLAVLGKIRSAGVTDLRFGNVLDEHRGDGDRFARTGDLRRELALPRDVDCHAVAATTSKVMRAKLPGDGLVPVDSALGRHARPELTLAFPEANRFIALGTGHLDLLDDAAVYERLRTWLASPAPPAPPALANRAGDAGTPAK